MKQIKKNIIIFLWCFALSVANAHTPRLAIVVVIDQFPDHIYSAISPYFRGGINYLLHHGANYTQAYYPHATPETATGHTALNTGTYASRHGIVGNSWLDEKGATILADDDASGTAHVFGSKKDAVGKSAINQMVDGISDQAILYPTPGHTNKVFALSLKSRAAIMCAGHLGKAVWFDAQQGIFTSSKAYFDELPCWVNNFNKNHVLEKNQTICWQLQYSKKSNAYALEHKGNKTLAKPRAGQTIPVYQDGSYDSFVKTPQATKLLLDLARTCIQEHLSCDRNDKLIMWISLSSTDLIGHEFGNESIEYVDMLYHVDCQLKKFMRFVHRLLKTSDVLWVLTGDHGAMPVSEQLIEKGYTNTYRIDIPKLQKNLNEFAQKNFGVDGLVTTIDTPNIYFDHKKLKSIEQKKVPAVTNDIKIMLSQTPGIRSIWTYEELQNLCVEPYSIEQFYKEQTYPGRTGQLLVLLEPYTLLTKYPSGTTHESPYNYDRHVPLIVYQKGILERKIINETVLMTQVAPTISHMLGIPKPSACLFNFLPGSVCHEIYG